MVAFDVAAWVAFVAAIFRWANCFRFCLLLVVILLTLSDVAKAAKRRTSLRLQPRHQSFLAPTCQKRKASICVSSSIILLTGRPSLCPNFVSYRSKIGL